MISRFYAYPDYWKGHSFFWEIDPKEHSYVLPLRFVVQRSITPDAPNSQWVDISPVITSNLAWQGNYVEDSDRVHRYFYRARGYDAAAPARTFVSQPCSMYGDLGKTDYLILRKMMSVEVRTMRVRAGVPLHLHIVDVRSSRCVHCTDPVTEAILDPDCSYCHGTGKEAGYYGPIKMWGTFTPDGNSKDYTSGSVIMVKDPAEFIIRVIGSPLVRAGESLITDLHNNKRYTVNSVESLAEIRRIPVVMNLKTKEVEKGSVMYDVGSSSGGSNPCP